MEIESKQYVSGDRRYRVVIIADEDATSPRDADNVTVMHTFDRGYFQPDDITRKGRRDSIFPRYDSNGDFDMRRARKYAALDPDILYVTGLSRNYDGSLSLNPGNDETDGYIAITRDDWETCMGATPATATQVEIVVSAEVDTYNRWARGEYVGVVVEEQVQYVLASQGPWDGHANAPAATLDEWVEIESLWGVDDPELGYPYAYSEALAWLPDDVVEV